MRPGLEGVDTHGAMAGRAALLEALRANAREHLRLRAGLVALGPGARMPGLYLAAAVSGGRLLLPAARIAEVALRVALDPVPGAAAWVAGSFLWRGCPALAADLGARLGGEPCVARDAVLVVLDGTPTVALLLDRVLGLVEDPLLTEAADGAGLAAGLLLGACRVEEEAVPLVAVEALEREVCRAA